MLLRLAAATILLANIATEQAFAQQIQLSSKQIERIGIKTQPVEAATSLSLATIPGKLTAPLYAHLAVTVPFGGTVLTVDVLEGAKTVAGKPLLSIASSDYLNAKATLMQQDAEYRMALASADRLRKLTNEGISAESRAEEAEAHLAQAEAALNATRDLLSPTESINNQIGVYNLIGSSDARVATLVVKPGESIDAFKTAIILQATDRIWLEAPLPAALAAKVRPGDSVTISPGDIQGKVIAVGLNVDPQSRSVIMRAEIDNKGDTRPGQNVLATIVAQAPPNALSVPREAIVRLADTIVVFIARGKGFDAVPITILARGRERATIVGQITAGDSVAISGLTELKSLAQQEN